MGESTQKGRMDRRGGNVIANVILIAVAISFAVVLTIAHAILIAPAI